MYNVLTPNSGIVLKCNYLSFNLQVRCGFTRAHSIPFILVKLIDTVARFAIRVFQINYN